MDWFWCKHFTERRTHMEEAKIPVLEFDDAIDELFVRHDGGQDTRKGVTRVTE